MTTMTTTETPEEKTARVYREAAEYRAAHPENRQPSPHDRRLGAAAGRGWASMLATGNQLERLQKWSRGMTPGMANGPAIYHAIFPDRSLPRHRQTGDPTPNRQHEYAAWLEAALGPDSTGLENVADLWLAFTYAAVEYYESVRR
jgi:hypothetical protein